VKRVRKVVVTPEDETLDDQLAAEPEAGEEAAEGEDEVVPEAVASGHSPARRIDADVILDTLVPSSVDWRGTVRRHPVTSVLTVGLVGYLIGRTKGAAIIAGATAGLSSALMRQLSDVFEGDFFDF
jgi:hypothetical protein